MKNWLKVGGHNINPAHIIDIFHTHKGGKQILRIVTTELQADEQGGSSSRWIDYPYDSSEAAVIHAWLELI